MTTLESQTLNAVCEYLELKGHFFFRNNNTPIYDATKNIFRKLPKYCIKGVSDIILLLNGTTWFLEIKNPKTLTKPKTYQSKEQKIFEKKVKNNGCQYEVIRSVDDLIRLGF